MERKKISKKYIEVEPLIELIDEYIEEYDTLEDGYHNPKWCAMQEARRSIEKQPTVDVVKVVRCKNCKYFKTMFCKMDIWHKDITLYRADENDFCSYGERKDE